MSEEHTLKIETIANGPFVENCYLVYEPLSKRGVVIDPGDEGERIVGRVRELDLEITEILATHAHIDHAGAVAFVKRTLGAPFAMHPADQPVLENMPVSAQLFGLPPKEVPTVDRELAADDTLAVGEVKGQVLATPGHSPGGCSFYFPEQRVVFVGDSLFAGSIGRTDLPGGDHTQLIHSIKEQLLSLDDDVVAYSGHGPQTTIGLERSSNPFL